MGGWVSWGGLGVGVVGEFELVGEFEVIRVVQVIVVVHLVWVDGVVEMVVMFVMVEVVGGGGRGSWVGLVCWGDRNNWGE